MASISQQQRHNIRKARKRDPIVSVFMHRHPKTSYSLSVPASKSWQEFLTKIRKQFKLPSDAILSLYRPPIAESNEDVTKLNLSNLHQYDLEESDMTKIKHQTTFCVLIGDCIDSSDSNDDSNSDSAPSVRSKSRKKRGKRKRSHSDAESSNESNVSSDSDGMDSESKRNAPNASLPVDESDFGLDLDLFGRLCTAKKAHSSKKNSKSIYHFHSQSTIQSLDYHFKSTWSGLKAQSLTVCHLDDQYTLMKSKDQQFTLRTRRMIWPVDKQQIKNGTEFECKLTDISSQWTWAIFIVHGGKFAGAVYRGNEMILHKTLRRYVVRKQQGKRQMNHLSSSGVKSGSAGGFKRARNEQKLLEEIREVLALWMDELATKCHRIFVHAPGVHNQMALYGNSEEQNNLYPQQNGILKEKLSSERLAEVRNRNKNRNVNLYRLYKKDERIQQIPITTNAVTLREVERVHYWLGTCWLNKNRESKQEKMDIVDNESLGGQNETQ